MGANGTIGKSPCRSGPIEAARDWIDRCSGSMPDERLPIPSRMVRSSAYPVPHRLMPRSNRHAGDRDGTIDIEDIETGSNTLHGHLATDQVARSPRQIDEPIAAARDGQNMDAVAFVPAERAGQRVAGASWHSACPPERQWRCAPASTSPDPLVIGELVHRDKSAPRPLGWKPWTYATGSPTIVSGSVTLLRSASTAYLGGTTPRRPCVVASPGLSASGWGEAIPLRDAGDRHPARIGPAASGAVHQGPHRFHPGHDAPDRQRGVSSAAMAVAARRNAPTP